MYSPIPLWRSVAAATTPYSVCLDLQQWNLESIVTNSIANRFCIDIPSTRVVHEADKKIFEILERYARAVPVIVVRTMKDRFINEHYGAARVQLEDAGYTSEELDNRARVQAEAEFRKVQDDDIRELEQKLGLNKDFAPFVYTSKRKYHCSSVQPSL
jgi:hypothetical protein